jgi:type II secretory pathway pseudopilin PulG
MPNPKRQLQSRSLANRGECFGLVEAGAAETRTPKDSGRERPVRIPHFGLRTSDFFRISTFDLRPSCIAFTLLEIMIVVGIMGLIMAMGVPIAYKAWHKAPMAKAVTDVVEVCSNARARAILQGQQVDLIIYPRERRFGVSSAAGGLSPSPGGMPAVPTAFVNVPSGSGLSGQLPDQVLIEDLDINKIPGGFRDVEQARVRFFPNGTCDEMSLFLLSDRGERCEILLEVTTGLANVEWDVRRFR